MENTITIQNVNKLPVPTWRWLKLNDSTISCENIGNFVDIKPQILNLSDEIQLDNHLPLNFPQINTGMGANANDFVKAHALAQKTIIIQENAKITEPISFIYTLNDGDTFIHDDYIHAKKNSEATLIFVYNAPYKSQGFHASSLKIFAEENTKINVIQLQTLGKDFTNFDDVGICSDDTAKISIKQIALGSERNWLGVNADLIQNNTKVKLNLDYILKKNQNVDINYVANIYGKKNDIEITANGILMHNAKKIMRGTLDFKQGCKGSVGNESENVLLLDEDIQNKSIPLILCGEDDIEGNHSASIGEMDKAQLFYLHTRGLNEEQIRQMQINSKIQLLCNDLPDKLHQYILNYQKEAF